MRATRVALVGICLVAIVSPFSAPVAAQQAQPADRNLAVSPLVAEISGMPGSVVHHQILVQNAGEASLQVTVGSRNFKAGSATGAPEFIEGEGDLSMASWIRAEPRQVFLRPLASQSFDVTIAIPQDAPSGGHYAAVIFGSLGQAPEGQSGVAIAQEVSSLILLTIPGEVREGAEIEDFTVKGGNWVRGEGPRFLERVGVPERFVAGRPAVEFRSKVRNSGNVHFRPSGSIALRSFSGKIVKNLSLESGYALPDSVRAIDTTWKQKPGIGRYTARLTVVNGNSNTVLTKETKFYVYPHPLWIVLIVVSLTLLWLLRRRLATAGRALLGRS